MPLEVAIVVYRPQLAELTASLEALARFGSALRTVISVHLWHNDDGPQATPGLEALAAGFVGRLSIRFKGGNRNLGYGRAINALLPDIAAPHLLALNQDAIPEPEALMHLWRTAQGDHARVAAWELRQIPYEHPKDYDPVTGETGWFSGAAVLLRTDAVRQVGGFEPRFFMYCEDVDLSWRLRCAGWRLRYLPGSAVVHRTYRFPGEIKPLAATQGAYANLCLRARYAGRRHVIDGIRQIVSDLRMPEPFGGHRRGLVTALIRFAGNYAYFRRTRRSGPRFEPCFRGRDYEMRRDGAFIPYRSAAERGTGQAAVTVLVRAGDDPKRAHDWLHCMAEQTQRPTEVIVVGGGDPAIASAWSAAGFPFEIRLLPALPAALDAVARVHACGDWWLTMDDDGLLAYADHIETLLDAALADNAGMAAAWTWTITVDEHPRGEAHRKHLPRSIDVARIEARPSRLVRRHEDADALSHLRAVDIGKVTTVRYRRSPN